ncbi:MAG: DHH family phosphoesterase [Nanoarchaeota archaeon]|nr:DHH family phosphoesterase [Nanoarchaeota archaeon]
MEPINFAAGSETRFLDFISKLNKENKIALLSHTDLDGVASAKVANTVIKTDLIKFINYSDINESLIQELKENKINTLITTDLMMTNPSIVESFGKNFNVLMIDHHTFEQDYNSDKIIYINAQDFCATYICYYLFSKIQNIEKLDWLVACASISDYMCFKNQEFMEKTLLKYDDKFTLEGNYVKKSGKFWDLQWTLCLAIIYSQDNLKIVLDSIGEDFADMKELKKSAAIVQSEIDNVLKKFEKEKISIKEGFFWEFSPQFKIGSIISNLISSKYSNKKIIIASPNPPYYKISSRRQDKKENMSLFIQNLVSGLEDAEGGGHIPAAGGNCLLKDKEIIIKRLKEL